MLNVLPTISPDNLPKYEPSFGLSEICISLVPEHSINPFSTLNSQGYMLSYLHELSRAFVEFSAVAPGPVLDIGTAYGFVALEALKKGACVIANDLEAEHLKDLRKRVSKNDLKKISFIAGRVPGEVNFDPSSLGAVLASGVLHYLSPSEFSLSIQNIANWLKSGGKFFLATPSPYTNLYQGFFPIFKECQKRNKKWPGYIKDASKILPEFFSNVPKSIYLIDEEFITIILEENGFELEKISFFSIKLPTVQFKEETNVLGVIACKI